MTVAPGWVPSTAALTAAITSARKGDEATDEGGFLRQALSGRPIARCVHEGLTDHSCRS